jgi:SAM-dependent methyltransferase
LHRSRFESAAASAALPAQQVDEITFRHQGIWGGEPMHGSAMDYGKKFFDLYLRDVTRRTIVEIGSLDINGSLRSVVPPGNIYLGLDLVEGKAVDLVIQDPYAFPFTTGSVDICVCSSCFEHIEFFWLSFNEALRILKPEGIFYLNVPSNGAFHRHPVDCWRFYPDSGIALQNWGRRNGYSVVMLESFVGVQKEDGWNDFVAIFLKDSDYIHCHPLRILDHHHEVMNGIRHDAEELINPRILSQDQEAHQQLRKLLKPPTS